MIQSMYLPLPYSELFLAYVEHIYETMIDTPRKELQEIEKRLKSENPAPLHTMFSQKQTRGEAINTYLSRKCKINRDCPPTCTG